MEIKSFRHLLILLFLPIFLAGQSPDLEKKIDAYLQPLIEMDAWSGVIGIYKNGDPVLEKAYGYADREWEIPMSIDGRFRIASISKVFTEVAILILAEQGKLDTEDFLAKFYPGFPSGQEITLNQLLNHTSGLPHLNSFENYDELIKSDYTLTEVISLFKDLPLDFEPGERYRYSNSGYVMLAYVIEQVSGLSYQSFLKEQIFDRIGLKNTGIDQSEQILAKRVKGYMFDPAAKLAKASYVNMDIKIGGGSLYSNLRDLAIFTHSLVEGQLLHETSLDQLSNIQTQNTGKFFTANGRVQGYCHQITHRYEDGLTVIVLGNHYSNIALPISQALSQIYNGQQVEAPKNHLKQKTV
ncbi:MAG: serine hydrolase domain-containing protein, partial [Bacteroidota bacterium]